MRVVIECAKSLYAPEETIVVRLLVINDSYETVALDRRMLVGPTPVPTAPEGLPHPVSREPAFATTAENAVLLNPWGIFGRERSFSGLPPGPVNFHGYLLSEPSDALLPDRPADPGLLRLAATPLSIEIGK